MTLLHHVTSRQITVLIIAFVFNDEYVKAGGGGVGVFNIAELIIFISSRLKFLPGGMMPPLCEGIISGRKRRNVRVNNIQLVMETNLMQRQKRLWIKTKEAATPSVCTFSTTECFFLVFLDSWRRSIAAQTAIPQDELRGAGLIISLKTV